LAQAIRTGEWLNLDVPLSGLTVTHTLSGPSVIAGKLTPELPTVNLQAWSPWATWLHVEHDGAVAASGILQPVSFDGPTVTVNAEGFSGYLHGLPFGGNYRAVQVDPADVVREIWGHVQGHRDAHLGVVMDPTVTRVRLGTPEKHQVKAPRDEWVPAREYGGIGAVRAAAGRLRTAGPRPNPYFVADGVSPLISAALKAQYDREQDSFTKDKAANFLQQVFEGKDQKMTRIVDAEPYELAWWDHKDCGSEVNNLAKQTPFDYCEVDSWDDDRRDVRHRLAIGYPRLGRRRGDLRFAAGENVLSGVPLAGAGEDYASEVVVLGAGDGRDKIRGSATEVSTERLRRVAVLTDKTVTTVSRARAIARAELQRRRPEPTLSELTVDGSHPNAPLGSFEPGDDVLVSGEFPWIGRIATWHRVTSYQWAAESTQVKLTVEPSAHYSYNPPVQGSVSPQGGGQ
jgi:hypothetical protein